MFGDHAKEKWVEWIWADFLCINADKSVQVAMMVHIYQKAQQITVWLGKATYIIEKSFKGMEKRKETLLSGHSRTVAGRAPGT
ncbi:hypothetical protein Vi05172_g4698 [Venturia inaequalis]|nr:hypothetical protein Vi05172_g4698 [Venturia inaequalis]